MDTKRTIIEGWDLYVIADVSQSGEKSYPRIFEQVLKGGAKVVQLREKNKSFKDLVTISRECRKITKDYGASFIVNDNPRLAKEVGADGVHVGLDDTPVNVAREILGDDKIIGLSTHTREQLSEAILSDADYFSVGPIFLTQSKTSDYKPVGPGLLRWALTNTATPVVAIGGINFRNIDMVIKTGVSVVAVISAVMAAQDMTQATEQILKAVRSFKGLSGNPFLR